MATPCVTGTIALMLSKDHELTPAQIDEILERTAIPLSAHKSNDFGSGRIDALAAVNAIGNVGIEEIGDNVSVYPNPTNGIINVNANGLKNIVVFNTFGQKVYETVDNQIDLSQLGAGLFLIRIETAQGVSMQRIIKDVF